MKLYRKYLLAINLIVAAMSLLHCASTDTELKSRARKRPGPDPDPSPGPPESSTSSVEKPANDRKIFLAVLGGRGSCDRFPNLSAMKSRSLTTDYAEFGKLLKSLETTSTIKPKYFVSCLPNDTPLTADFQYFTSSDESKRGNAPPNKTNLRSLASLITALARDSDELYVIGHSYGGWSAMSIAPTVAKEKPLTALMTLDPISARNCTPFSGFMQFVRQNGTSCLEAPTDFGPSGLMSIKASTRQWINFYQVANESLHSSVIAEASENHEMEFEHVRPINGIFDYKNPHYFVGVNSPAWKRLGEVILSFNNLNQ